MTDIAFWLGLTTIWLLIFIGAKPMVAYGRWCSRILWGSPDNVNPLIMIAVLRVVTTIGVLFCATGVVGAIVQRLG